jgi:hypothetical protein
MSDLAFSNATRLARQIRQRAVGSGDLLDHSSGCAS